MHSVSLTYLDFLRETRENDMQKNIESVELLFDRISNYLTSAKNTLYTREWSTIGPMTIKAVVYKIIPLLILMLRPFCTFLVTEICQLLGRELWDNRVYVGDLVHMESYLKIEEAWLDIAYLRHIFEALWKSYRPWQVSCVVPEESASRAQGIKFFTGFKRVIISDKFDIVLDEDYQVCSVCRREPVPKSAEEENICSLCYKLVK
jgi:isoleucyl-tRNA synthetase